MPEIPAIFLPQADCYKVDPAEEGEILQVDLELLSEEVTTRRREGDEDEAGEGGSGKANTGTGVSYWARGF